MESNSTVRSWVITLLGALFFFYAFLQVNLLGILAPHLTKYFHASSTSIGLLSGWYFYGNVLFLLPAGLILDRFSIRKIMGSNMLLVIFSTLLFAFSTNIYIASFARFLAGIMMAFGLITCLKLASMLLPPSQMALASSLIVTIGMLGGMITQRPMASLLASFTWQESLYFVAAFGAIIATVLWFFVKEPAQNTTSQTSDENPLLSLWQVMKEPQNWLAGFYTCLLNLPVAVLGALFGFPFLVKCHGFSVEDAGSIVGMLFLGMIVGSPIFGWISDALSNRKVPMFMGGVACLLCMYPVLYGNFSPLMMYLLFFLLGFTSSAQVLGYPVIAESNAPKNIGSAMSLAAILIMGVGYGLGLPLIGKLLDLGWAGQMVDGERLYSITAYRQALLAIPFGIVLSLISLLFLKETRQRIFAKEKNRK